MLSLSFALRGAAKACGFDKKMFLAIQRRLKIRRPFCVKERECMAAC